MRSTEFRDHPSGFVVDAIGYPWFFVYTSCLGLPALVLLYLITRDRGEASPARSRA